VEAPSAKARYAAFCAAHPQVPVFCQPWYLDAVAEHGHWDVALLTAGEHTLAALPYFHKRRLGLHYATMPLFTKHLGIIPAPDLPGGWTAARVHQLLANLPPLAGFDQQFSPLANDLIPHLPTAYTATPYLTYRIDLATFPNWQARINRNMRRNIKKAAAQLQLRTDLDLATFYRVNALSFTRQGLPVPYTFDQLQRHDAALARHQARQIFAAVSADGQIHSVAYLIWDRHAAYYHLSGDDPALRHSGSGIWLIAQAITFTQQQLQLPIFDFEGSMIPAVAAIRQQFGAQPTTYYRVQAMPSWRYRLLKKWRT